MFRGSPDVRQSLRPRVALACAAVALTLTSMATAAEWSPRLERRVREALTPAQLADFAAGADPQKIRLDDGRTLDAIFAEAAKEATTALAYTPLDPCLLARTNDS